MMMVSSKILIAEEHPGQANILKAYFEGHHLNVLCVSEEGEVVRVCKQEKPDILLLEISSLTEIKCKIISEICQGNCRPLVIAMTFDEPGDEEQLKMYELGVAFYVKNPFVPRILLAQIKSVLKICDVVQYKTKDLSVYIKDQLLVINGERTILRDKDAVLLFVLLRENGRVVSRSNLLETVWKSNCINYNNLLDGSILRLRKSLTAFEGINIRSVYGTGYILEFDEN